MLMIRNFLKTLIGSVTPFQVLLACVLGALLGFLPITNGGTIAALVLVLLLLSFFSASASLSLVIVEVFSLNCLSASAYILCLSCCSTHPQPWPTCLLCSFG